MSFQSKLTFVFSLCVFKNRRLKSMASFLKAEMFAEFHSCMLRLGGFFLAGFSVVSIETILWSPRPSPGIIFSFLTKPGVFVKKRSKMELPQVGFVTVWDNPKSLLISKNLSFISKGYLLPTILSSNQSISGRLKSPPTQNTAF